MKSLKQYITEAASSKIKQVCSKLKLHYDVDPLDYYVYMQDELSLSEDPDNEIDAWIDGEISQIITDIHNVDKSIDDFTSSKEYKQFMKLFTKEYKKESYYNVAIKFYTKLSEATD